MDFQNCKKINEYDFKPLNLKEFVTAAMGNKHVLFKLISNTMEPKISLLAGRKLIKHFVLFSFVGRLELKRKMNGKMKSEGKREMSEVTGKLWKVQPCKAH